MIEKKVDQFVRPLSIGSIPLSRLPYQFVDIPTKRVHLLGTAGRHPASQDRGVHLGMELHGEIPVKYEGLR
jgi:hypothetical protein